MHLAEITAGFVDNVDRSGANPLINSVFKPGCFVVMTSSSSTDYPDLSSAGFACGYKMIIGALPRQGAWSNHIMDLYAPQTG